MVLEIAAIAFVVAPAHAGDHLQHFGFVAVDSGWHDPLDVTHPLRTNYVDEVAGFTDTNHTVVFDYHDDMRARLAAMRRKRMKALLAVEGVLFDNNPPAPTAADQRVVRPFADYRERWARFVATNRARLTPDYVQTVYVVDEPYGRGLTFDEVKAATDLVASTLPTIPVSIVEAWFALDKTRIPTSVDWVGFDDFIGNPDTDRTYARELNKLKSLLSRPDQRLMIVMWSNWTAQECCARDLRPYVPGDMAQVAKRYYALARREPKAVALIGYLWSGGIDGPQLGARDLPERVTREYARIGRQILRG
jgi:hypothetical protein